MFNRLEKGLWWDEGIKLVSGCTRVSEACDKCWALGMDNRFNKTTEIKFHKERLVRFTKKKPTVFAIWNDLFHKEVMYNEIIETFQEMSNNPQHLYLVLTKRVERLQQCLEVEDSIKDLKNIWFGTTVENQRAADERIPLLLQTPASKRFLSVEPMLGKIDINSFMPLSLVIIGCESGSKRRETKIEWVESLINQCKTVGVPVFVKQLEIDGKVCKDINKFPKHLQHREIPGYKSD